MVLVVSTRTRGAVPLILFRTGHFLLVTNRWFSPCSGRTVRPQGGGGKRSGVQPGRNPKPCPPSLPRTTKPTRSPAEPPAQSVARTRPKRAAFVHRGRVAHPQSFPAPHATGRLSPRGAACGRSPHQALAGQGPLGLAPQPAHLAGADLRRGRMGRTPRPESAGPGRGERDRPAQRRLRGPGAGPAVPGRRALAGPGRGHARGQGIRRLAG